MNGHLAVRTRGHLIVGYCSSMHLVWAWSLLVDPAAAAHVTAISALYETFGANLWWILVLVAALALVPVFRQQRGLTLIAWMMPQQLILFVAAHGALHAMILSRFADLADYPRFFIIPDQYPAPGAFLFHFGALVWSYFATRAPTPRSGDPGR
jgi:hypothetical protein